INETNEIDIDTSEINMDCLETNINNLEAAQLHLSHDQNCSMLEYNKKKITQICDKSSILYSRLELVA
ncbi:10339_t:CDS:2, partial [Racocetra fulgida]